MTVIATATPPDEREPVMPPSPGTRRAWPRRAADRVTLSSLRTAAAAALLTLGLALPWVHAQPANPVGPFGLPVRIPGESWLGAVSYGVPVAVALTLVVTGLLLRERGVRLVRSGGVVAAVASGGFLLLALTA